MPCIVWTGLPIDLCNNCSKIRALVLGCYIDYTPNAYIIIPLCCQTFGILVLDSIFGITSGMGLTSKHHHPQEYNGWRDAVEPTPFHPKVLC